MKEWFHSGIFRKNILSILTVSLVPLLILGALALRSGSAAGDESIARSSEALDAKSTEALELRAIETANAVAAFLTDREADLRTLALLPRSSETYQAFDQAHQGTLWTLENGQEVHLTVPLYREIAYVDASGQEVLKIEDGQVSGPDALRDVSDPANTLYRSETYFAEASQLPPGEIYVSHVTGFYLSQADFQAGKRYSGVLRFAMPVFDPAGRLDGIVVLALDVRHLEEFTEHIVPTEQRFAVEPDPNTGNYAYMIDDLAYTIAHPTDYLMQGVGPNGETLPYATQKSELGALPVRLDQLGFADENLASIPALAAQGKAGSIQYFWAGHDKFLAYAPIPYYGGPYNPPAGFGWIGIGADTATFHQAATQVGNAIHEKVKQLGFMTLIVLAVTAVFVLVVAGLLAHQVSAPIQRITEAARSVERGDFQLDMLDRLNSKKHMKDEISHLAHVFREMAAEVQKRDQYRRLLDAVISIGVALPQEKDFDRLLETVVLEAKALCNADAGLLYFRTEEDQLKYVIVRNDSLGIQLGGTADKTIPYPPIPLYDEAHAPNQHNIASYTVHQNTTVNIPDVYQEHNFSDTRQNDAQTGYRSRSVLSTPLKANSDEAIGVLQVINALNPKTGDVIAFDEGMNRVIESLASLGTVALKAYMREAQLRQQIERLRVEIDEVKRKEQVAEITETDYFQELLGKAKILREQAGL